MEPKKAVWVERKEYQFVSMEFPESCLSDMVKLQQYAKDTYGFYLRITTDVNTNVWGMKKELVE